MSLYHWDSPWQRPHDEGDHYRSSIIVVTLRCHTPGRYITRSAPDPRQSINRDTNTTQPFLGITPYRREGVRDYLTPPPLLTITITQIPKHGNPLSWYWDGCLWKPLSLTHPSYNVLRQVRAQTDGERGGPSSDGFQNDTNRNHQLDA